MPRKDNDEHEPEEEEFVKVDKRAPRDVEEPGAPADEAGAAGAEPAPGPAPSASDEERPQLTVYSLLRMAVGMFAEQAWIHLGLRMDPSAGKTEANLPLAKIAIDTLAYMVEQLQPDLDSSDKRELEGLLANLRINYVQRA